MTNSEAYIEFLKGKIPRAEVSGFEPLSPAHPGLSPHARDIAEWMVRGGRRACFAAFGLHKTRIQLQVAKWVVEKVEAEARSQELGARSGAEESTPTLVSGCNGKFLIVAPLGVRQEFTRSDGPALGMTVEYVRNDAEVAASGAAVLITNYERVRDGNIDVSRFAGTSLDESSVLRSFGSKTYQEFLKLFKSVRYRFVATATPSPNRYKELIHYGGFLGIMDTGEALTRFFQRDSSQANNLTLYPHMEKQFWLWLSSWAVFIERPSDLGHSDAGYVLPEIDVQWHRLEVDHRAAWSQTDGWGQAQLLRDDAQGLAGSAAIKRESIDLRVRHARNIIEETDDALPPGAPPEHWLLWHDLEAEREAIEKLIPEAKTVYGTQDLEERENLIMDFANGKYPILATKPIIAGSGCNFQRHCARAIFLGVGYKFNDFIQAIHRIQRFGQARRVTIHIIYLESEQAIRDELEAKWRRHNELMAVMTELLRKNRLTLNNTMELIRTLGCERAAVRGKNFVLVNNDCVLELQSRPPDSIDMICTSIPFGNQYEYSPSYNDFGHNTGDDPFFKQMDFLVPECLRTLRPGRIAAIHVKDRIMFGNVTGLGGPTVNPFSDKVTQIFTKHGFVFLARITIDTDVVRENNQTYRLGWSENAKDSTKMGAGMPEYVLIFRKLPSDLSNAYADVPVQKSKADYTRADWQLDAAGLWRSNGNRLPDPEVLKHMNLEDVKRLWIDYSLAGGYSHEEHVDLARELERMGKLPASFMLFPPVSRHADIWTDIARMKTLNAEQSRRNLEMHVCPLQLDVIKRLIRRYSNEGDIVLDPFAGIGSVAYQALKMGRKADGVELNREYWRCGVGYCEMVENELNVPTLFDLGEVNKAPQAA